MDAAWAFLKIDPFSLSERFRGVRDGWFWTGWWMDLVGFFFLKSGLILRIILVFLEEDGVIFYG